MLETLHNYRNSKYDQVTTLLCGHEHKNNIFIKASMSATLHNNKNQIPMIEKLNFLWTCI